MKQLRTYIITGATVMLLSSCSDFLDTAPKNAMSPGTTWKTETDAQKFAIGCYGGNDNSPGWEEGDYILYLDCASDFGYNNFEWEQYKLIGNGGMTPSGSVASFYNFEVIRRCNTFLEKIESIPFSDEKTKKDLIAQVRFIRAYRYFVMNWWYGGVPIIDIYNSAGEAQVPRETEANVKKFVDDELDAIIPDLNDEPAERGRIAKGAALALKMRSALYYGEYQRAQQAAESIISLHKYELEPTYDNLFKVSGQDSKEIILAVQYINSTKTLYTIGQMYNNADGGWSSIVPTQNLIDTYEMKDGLTKEESKHKGGADAYDPVHPFANRDPRMEMTVMYPGMDWNGGIINTLDKDINGKTNPNYPTAANNSSKTALTWRKYLDPLSQYAGGMWKTNACPIVFRYAEVLLSYAEAANELAGPSDKVYNKIDQVRNRAGMPSIDRAKYNTKEKLRELIRRERAVEFAGEGLRRADILRWKESSGKMLAETVLNGTLNRISGSMNLAEKDPTKRAVVNVNASPSEIKIEDRTFKPFNRYNPIPQDDRSNNPKLEQNPGYAK